MKLCAEEREAFENLPRNVQLSKRCETRVETMKLLDSLCDTLDRIILIN